MLSIHPFSFSSSVPHSYFVHAQKELGEDKVMEGKPLQERELKALSKTQWCCQVEACDAVVATLGSIEHFQTTKMLIGDLPARHWYVSWILI